MKLQRALYLVYYLKQLEREKFKLFLDYTSKITGISKSAITRDVIRSVFNYNISILEYFQFRFFELDKDQRNEWAGTGYMYEFQRRMNPISARSLLENKPEFMQEYAEFIKHEHTTVKELKSGDKIFEKLLNTKSGKLVLKRSDGGCGKGIKIIGTEGLTKQKLLDMLAETDNDMVEEYVIQHKELMRLSPSGLNTIRIITQFVEDDRVEIVGCRLRITVHSHVDNMAAGNIAASIDPDTGIVTSEAVYSDMTKPSVNEHPVTNVTIKGFQLPFWDETIAMIKKAALKNTSNRSIGWDVAITDYGPELIEGNHDWCKLLWQLPERQGLKEMIDKY